MAFNHHLLTTITLTVGLLLQDLIDILIPLLDEKHFRV